MAASNSLIPESISTLILGKKKKKLPPKPGETDGSSLADGSAGEDAENKDNYVDYEDKLIEYLTSPCPIRFPQT